MKWFIPIFIAIASGAVVFGAYFLNQNPLVVDGFSEYNNGRKKIDISILNKGKQDVFIYEVKVNNTTPQKTQLVISYSGHLAGSGIDFEPSVRFLKINEKPIHPQLKPQEIDEALGTPNTPIHYGIRLLNDEDIESVTIKYKYCGIPFEKEINLNTWPA